MKTMRTSILALLGLIWMANTSFGATWFLQGTGDFDNPTTWCTITNGGPNGVPDVGDTLQFYGGEAPWPMWDADYTITLNTNQTVTRWDQGYWKTTVRLALNGHDFTVTDAASHVLSEGSELTWPTANYVSGGGTLTINGHSASGRAASGFFLSGTGTKMVLNGDNGNLLGGSPGNEARILVSGGATVTGTTTWASTRVGGRDSLVTPLPSAIIHLSDPGTRMDLNGGPMVVGDQGQGQLIVTNGAAFTTSGGINLGGWQYGGVEYDGTNGHGTIRVDGAGTTFSAATMDVGMYSTGVVQVVHGGMLTNIAYYRGIRLGAGYSESLLLTGGTNTAAYGILEVANPGSRVDVDVLVVGIEGTGEVTVSDNAVLAAAGSCSFKNSKLTVSDAEMTMGGNLTMAGSATNTIRIELGARNPTTAYIQMGLALDLTASTTLDLAVLCNFSAAVDQTIKLIGYGSLIGTFSNYADQAIITKGAYKFKITYGANDISLTVTEVNSPTPPTLNFLPGVSDLTFSWSEAGFKLQSQTNGLSTGNWFDYSGGGTSPVTVPVNPANPTVFFRLKSTCP